MIAKTFNEEGIKGKVWHDSVIGKIIRNPVYVGDYISNRGKKNEVRYYDVCPPIIDKDLWDYCQGQAPKNLRYYKRDKEYIFLQKLSCPKCVRIMGDKATTKKIVKEYYYYSCEISPTIFGAVFESTLNPETRRSGGMHYTSIENIHKVIDPLFFLLSSLVLANLFSFTLCIASIIGVIFR